MSPLAGCPSRTRPLALSPLPLVLGSSLRVAAGGVSTPPGGLRAQGPTPLRASLSWRRQAGSISSMPQRAGPRHSLLLTAGVSGLRYSLPARRSTWPCACALGSACWAGFQAVRRPRALECVTRAASLPAKDPAVTACGRRPKRRVRRRAPARNLVVLSCVGVHASFTGYFIRA